MRKYRIVYQNEKFKIEYHYFAWIWKPLLETLYNEEIERTFSNMYDLELYLKELVDYNVSNHNNFSILFL